MQRSFGRRFAWMLLAPIALSLFLGCKKFKNDDVKSADDAPETSEESASATEDEDEDEEQSDEQASDQTDEATAEEDQDEGKSDEQAETKAKAKAKDLAEIAQAVMDDEELNPYWNIGTPGRLPVLASGIPAGLELTKGGKPVEIVEGGKASDKPVFRFTEIDVSGNKATVRYRYDVERVRGSAVLEKRYGRWELTRSRVTKHRGPGDTEVGE